jgi:hypothetical protein
MNAVKLWRMFALALMCAFVMWNMSSRDRVSGAAKKKGTFGRTRKVPGPAVVQREVDPNPVPNIAHFIFGLDPNFGHMGFGLIHYMAILGASRHIQPKSIRLHYLYEPEGPWWECAKPLVDMVLEKDVTEVYGKPMKMKVQHKADILRMNIMLNEGGIYLVSSAEAKCAQNGGRSLILCASPFPSLQDSDVIPLRSFSELRLADLTMGLEGDAGLCNAVMVGIPNSTFIRRWWGEYKTFDPEHQWAYHSVQLPRQLQRQHPEEVTVLSEKAFFYPSWIHLRTLYDEDDGYDYADNFAVHLWTSADERQRNRLAKLSVSDVYQGRGSFHRIARKLLEEAESSGKLCETAAEDVRLLSKMITVDSPKR